MSVCLKFYKVPKELEYQVLKVIEDSITGDSDCSLDLWLDCNDFDLKEMGI